MSLLIIYIQKPQYILNIIIFVNNCILFSITIFYLNTYVRLDINFGAITSKNCKKSNFDRNHLKLSTQHKYNGRQSKWQPEP